MKTERIKLHKYFILNVLFKYFYYLWNKLTAVAVSKRL